jgi:hypothetical protein
MWLVAWLSCFPCRTWCNIIIIINSRNGFLLYQRSCARAIKQTSCSTVVQTFCQSLKFKAPICGVSSARRQGPVRVPAWRHTPKWRSAKWRRHAKIAVRKYIVASRRETRTFKEAKLPLAVRWLKIRTGVVFEANNYALWHGQLRFLHQKSRKVHRTGAQSDSLLIL